MQSLRLDGKSLINQKGGCIASKTQQSDSLWLAVNPPPFDKGGKCGGAKQGIVRFWKVMRGEGLLSFCNGCEGDSIRCNGRGKKGK